MPILGHISFIHKKISFFFLFWLKLLRWIVLVSWVSLSSVTGKRHPESVPVGKDLLSWRQFEARVDPPLGRLHPSWWVSLADLDWNSLGHLPQTNVHGPDWLLELEFPLELECPFPTTWLFEEDMMNLFCYC